MNKLKLIPTLICLGVYSWAYASSTTPSTFNVPNVAPGVSFHITSIDFKLLTQLTSPHKQMYANGKQQLNFSIRATGCDAKNFKNGMCAKGTSISLSKDKIRQDVQIHYEYIGGTNTQGYVSISPIPITSTGGSVPKVTTVPNQYIAGSYEYPLGSNSSTQTQLREFGASNINSGSSNILSVYIAIPISQKKAGYVNLEACYDVNKAGQDCTAYAQKIDILQLPDTFESDGLRISSSPDTGAPKYPSSCGSKRESTGGQETWTRVKLSKITSKNKQYEPVKVMKAQFSNNTNALPIGKVTLYDTIVLFDEPKRFTWYTSQYQYWSDTTLLMIAEGGVNQNLYKQFQAWWPIPTWSYLDGNSKNCGGKIKNAWPLGPVSQSIQGANSSNKQNPYDVTREFAVQNPTDVTSDKTLYLKVSGIDQYGNPFTNVPVTLKAYRCSTQIRFGAVGNTGAVDGNQSPCNTSNTQSN